MDEYDQRANINNHIRANGTNEEVSIPEFVRTKRPLTKEEQQIAIAQKRFDKALKLCRKRGYPIEELRKAIAILVENGSLPSEYKPHILHGNHEGEWEAHIKPNWLLVWEQNDDELTLLMLTTGTHSDVFGKTRR